MKKILFSAAVLVWICSTKAIHETSAAGRVNTGDLTVKHGAFDMEMFSDPSGKIRESPEHVAIS